MSRNHLIVQKQAVLDEAAVAGITARLGGAPLLREAARAVWDVAPQGPEVLDGLAAQYGVDAANVRPGLGWADFRLLAIDMDSTLVTMETLDEIADMAGLKAEVAAITEAAMRGEIRDFSESLMRRMALLKGVHVELIERVYRERLQLSPGAEVLLAAARQHGLKTMLVSGGFTHFTDPLSERLGFDFAFANQFDIAHDRLTGRVLGPIVDRDFKADVLKQCCASIGCSLQQAMAIGDGANDLGMMEIAGLSVGYHAKPLVREHATWSIRCGGLDVMSGWLSA